MDKIFLRALTTEAIIGLYDWERHVKQTLVIDVDIATDVRATAAHDDINRTLNYKAVAKRILAFVGESRYHLIETLAEELARALIAEFKLSWLRLSVHKPGAIRHSRDVGVEIERTAESAAVTHD
jgi:dihydroneopterin aldolase